MCSRTRIWASTRNTKCFATRKLPFINGKLFFIYCNIIVNVNKYFSAFFRLGKVVVIFLVRFVVHQDWSEFNGRFYGCSVN